MTRLTFLETTVQRTHEWLRDIKTELGFDNDRAAYAALRATLHGLRDLLGTDQVAQLGAQLPTLVRGLYDEGWNPAPGSAACYRPRHDFLESVRRPLHEHLELRNTEHAARIVFSVMKKHISPGEIEKIVQSLPKEVRALWYPENAI